MDNKELCFIINDKKIYLEKVLVDFEDVPIFFLCSDGNNYYFSLCSDMDNFQYMVVESSIQVVYNLLHGKIPMRDVFINANEGFWEVFSGNIVEEDKVRKCNISELSDTWLPKRDAVYQVLTDEEIDYLNTFDRFYSSITEKIHIDTNTTIIIEEKKTVNLQNNNLDFNESETININNNYLLEAV